MLGIVADHPPSLFAVADRPLPDDGMVAMGDDGERHACPAAMNAPGFFEGPFVGKPKANAVFWKRVNRQLTSAI